ncbi:MAG: hypothetical protein ABIG67_00650 [Pseudomonadota bacterium]
MRYFFKKPDRISPDILHQIKGLIVKAGGVGTAYIEENLRNAYLIGYATHRDRVVGSVTHKVPKIEYRKKIEEATGWDLSGYIERGYTSADPEFRDQDIPDVLIKGLIERSKGKKIYVTIRMNNIPPLKLTYKNGMSLVAKYIHPKTGNEVGLFINQRVPPPAVVMNSGKKTL